MIKVSQLEKSVAINGEILHILKGISLEIKQGESVAITGTSGSGKSTLLGLMAGLDVPSAGEVWLDGVSLKNTSEDQRSAIRRKKVSFIFQSFQLMSGMTALENVSLPAELLGIKNAKQQATELLGQVGLQDRLGHYPKQLSGGEQQRVAIARAFVTSPQLLFADEPTGNLDSKTGEQIIQYLFDLNKATGTTLVLVTHEKRLALLCEKEYVLEAGELVSDNI